MDIVGQAIQNYLILNCNDESLDLSHEFNSMVAIGYWEKEFISAYRDQRYDCHGNFVMDQNCQKRYRPTCILAIGDTCCIKFQLMRRSTPDDNVPGLVNVENCIKLFDL